MTKMVRVRSLLGDKVAAYEENPEHPGGYAMVSDDQRTY